MEKTMKLDVTAKKHKNIKGKEAAWLIVKNGEKEAYIQIGEENFKTINEMMNEDENRDNKAAEDSGAHDNVDNQSEVGRPNNGRGDKERRSK